MDGVSVPTTLEEYCQLCKPKTTQSQSSYDIDEDMLAGEDDYYQDSSSDEMESSASEPEESGAVDFQSLS